MNTTAPRQKVPRRYAFACAQCRRKKIRCDGEQPQCKRCKQNDETCHYAQRATESRLEQAKSRIEQLEAELAQRRPPVSPTSSSDAQHSRSTQVSDSTANEAYHAAIASAATHEQDDISPHVGLDEHGDVTYHGPTSRFSVGGLAELQGERNSYPQGRNSQQDHAAALESNYDMMHQVWEPLLETKTTQDLGVEPNLVQRLLNLFWTWQYPLHNYIYRPCFIMDMALGGPYYSKFLLHCILALSARHLEADSADNAVAHKGEKFLSTAKELLIHEIGATKPKIPTIQGLLILSGRQCAVGKTSEGWLYTGMAIRMMIDLGLHLNFQELMHLEKLTPVELEVRKRLYCSAYIWDKSLSLSLGRPPALTLLPPTALHFLDHADDQHAWLPQEYPEYPSTDAHQTTCFTFFCHLGAIIELIMIPVPSRTSRETLKQRLSDIERKLQSWYDELPEPLRMDPRCEVCPPPHILSLNLLYHTLHIILWRPYLNFPDTACHATTVCVRSAQSVHNMFVVYGRTFQWRKMTYLVSYCVYTAATVDVHEMKSLDTQRRQEATKRLAVSLQILESESRQTPGIRRSIDIIKRQLRTWTPSRTQEHQNSSTANTARSELNGQNTRASNLEFQESWQRQASSGGPGSAGQQTNEHMQHQVYFDPNNNSWNMQQDSVYDINGLGTGYGFVDTSAGFHLPWSFDETSDFNFFDAQIYGTDGAV